MTVITVNGLTERGDLEICKNFAIAFTRAGPAEFGVGPGCAPAITERLVGDGHAMLGAHGRAVADRRTAAHRTVRGRYPPTDGCDQTAARRDRPARQLDHGRYETACKQVKAASAALPFERAKLSVSVQVTGPAVLGNRLDGARTMKTVSPPLIEHVPVGDCLVVSALSCPNASSKTELSATGFSPVLVSRELPQPP